MMTTEFEAIFTALCFGSLGGFVFVLMWVTFRFEDRYSTRRFGARPGQGEQRFQADSKQPWRKSNDMLADETHPSRKNED